MLRRRALTLLECIVCIAIAAILIGLVVVAAQSARDAAQRVESKNNLRQMIVATHNFATAMARFPSVDGNLASANPNGYGLLVAIRPFLGFEAGAPPNLEGLSSTAPFPILPAEPVYLSPADPSINRGAAAPYSSYAVNAVAYSDDPTAQSFQDGTSNTLAFAEHYSTNCGTSVARTGYLYQPGTVVSFGYGIGMTGLEDMGTLGMVRRSTFADQMNGDITPDDDANTTFQVAPSLLSCDPRLAQTPHRSGMLTAFADGSVRQLSPGIAPHVYWALITPAGGEAVEVPD